MRNLPVEGKIGSFNISWINILLLLEYLPIPTYLPILIYI